MRGMDSWIRGAGLAVAYGLAFLTLRNYAPLTLNLPIGLRFAALLFLPTRWWPWVIAGELGATSTWTIQAVAQHHYTLTWLLIGTFMPVIGGLLPVSLMRRAEADGDISSPMAMATFIGSAALGGVASALISTLAASVAGKAVGMPLPTLFMMYVTGAFAGILCVVPVGAMAKEWRARGYPFRTSGPIQEFLAATGYVCIGVVAISTLPSDYLTLSRALLFAPMVIATLIRGWRGAATVGALCTIALQITQRRDLEPPLVAAQDVASVAIAGVMLFGAVLTYHRRMALIAQERERALAAMVRRHTTRAEAQFRHSASIVDEVCRMMVEAEAGLRDSSQKADRTLHWWSTSHAVRQHLRQLRETLHPHILEAHGLRAAIAAGPIPKVLSSCEVEYDLTLHGRPGMLAEELQTSLYRLAYESVCILLRNAVPERMRINLRVGQNERTLYAALTVTAIVSEGGEWRPGVATMSTGLSLDSLKLVAESFRGRVTHDVEGHKISMVLLDGSAARLWEDQAEPIGTPDQGRAESTRKTISY